MQKSANITWHGPIVDPSERQQVVGQKGAVVWLTGLSASGKSTIARRAEQLLLERGAIVYVLDGDNIRFGLNKDLGFSPEDRTENIRRIGEVAKLFADACVVTLTAFISPYRADRDKVRALMPQDTFIECYVEASVATCEARDPKGLYKKARAGQIPEFTGISAPYEEPVAAELVIPTADQTVDESALALIRFLEERGFIKPS
ncbi:MAG: adenylyl-sulfate kinase [Pseudomonadota bacterium]|nr:adenylyl-sulfate kinase [Pseudomonadota bacterium]